MYQKIKSSKFVLLVTFASFLALAGCATVKPLTDLEKRNMTTKSFNGSYSTIYSSTQAVIQDEQYVIQQSSKDSGFINGQKTKDNSHTGTTFLGFAIKRNLGDGNSVAATQVRTISATIQKNNSKSATVRLTIQDKGMNRSGGVVSSKQVYDPKTYAQIFNKIRVEISRQEAMK